MASKKYITLDRLSRFKENADETYVAKEDGKGLSSNDYTDEDKEKLAGITNMTGATADANGKAGLVPVPVAGKQEAYLRGDGTWTDFVVATEAEIDELFT